MIKEKTSRNEASINPEYRARTRISLTRDYIRTIKEYNSLIQTYIIFGLQVRKLNSRTYDKLTQLTERLQDIEESATTFDLRNIRGDTISFKFKIEKLLKTNKATQTD